MDEIVEHKRVRTDGKFQCLAAIFPGKRKKSILVDKKMTSSDICLRIPARHPWNSPPDTWFMPIFQIGLEARITDILKMLHTGCDCIRISSFHGDLLLLGIAEMK